MASNNVGSDNVDQETSNTSGWCTIESDPGVFTTLIQELGAKGVQVEELYGLDVELTHELQPILGLIFLFKWDAALQGNQSNAFAANQSSNEMIPDGMFFARQTVQNACATQAILSILLNLSRTIPGFELGPHLSSFKEFCSALPPNLCGDAIGNNTHIRTVHNSFVRPELLLLEEEDRKGRKKDEEGETPFHFIGILPIGGTLYEFDGLCPGPIPHGPVNENDWLEPAFALLRAKIEAIQQASIQSEIRFNLMAVVRDRLMVLQEQRTNNLKQLEMLQGTKNSDEQIGRLLAENEGIDVQMEAEQQKRERWHKENIMRRHNWIPLAMTLLSKMHQAGTLDEYHQSPKEERVQLNLKNE